MIAHIIPIKRMPRTLGLLSYSVPSTLQHDLGVGQLVRIPLRESSIYGLVFSIEQNHPKEELKAIDDIVYTTPLLSQTQLDLMIQLADTYAISYGSAALLFTPPLQKRKLSKEMWKPIQPQHTHTISPSNQTLALYTSQHELHSTLCQVTKGTLVIVPEIADIDTVTTALSDDLQIITWHSELSTKEQYDRWFQIRSGAYDVIVGTRAALFLPYPTLHRIIVYREEDNAHKSWDQKPLYDVHDLVILWSSAYQAAVNYLTYSPRFSTYYHTAKGTIVSDTSALAKLHAPLTRPTIISMQEERKAGNYELLAESVLQSITAAIGDVVLYINRKGFASAVGCTDCDFVSRCTRCGMAHVFYATTKTLRCHYCGTADRVPQNCPRCSGATLQPFGVGTEQVEQYITKACASLPHHIIRIDSNQEHIAEFPADTPVILIGTDKMLSHVRWDMTAIYTMVQIDDQLLYPDFRALESVWHTMRRIDYHLPQTAEWYVQTMQPEHLLFRSLREPERLYRTELHARQTFHMPPYSKLIRLSIGKPTEFAAKTEATRVYQLLTRTLTEQGISARLREPYTTSPTFYRGQNWYTILLTLEPHSWSEDIKHIIELLPGNWRVDISPQSLLSP